MRVTKPIDLELLGQELTAATVPYRLLLLTPVSGGSPHEADLLDQGDDGESRELPLEAVPIVEAHDATKKDRTAAFETYEDQERLRVVNERATEDPAFAALADLTLGKERY